MLTLTESARTIVSTIAAQSDDAEKAGLRISTPPAGANEFTVTVAPAPEPQDEVIETEGARVFLDEDVAVVLADRVLDAQVDDEGSVRFALARSK